MDLVTVSCRLWSTYTQIQRGLRRTPLASKCYPSSSCEPSVQNEMTGAWPQVAPRPARPATAPSPQHINGRAGPRNGEAVAGNSAGLATGPVSLRRRIAYRTPMGGQVVAEATTPLASHVAWEMRRLFDCMKSSCPWVNSGDSSLLATMCRNPLSRQRHSSLVSRRRALRATFHDRVRLQHTPI